MEVARGRSWSRKEITDVRLMSLNMLYRKRKQRKEILANAVAMLEIEKEVLDEEELAKSKTVVEEARRRVKECDDQLKTKEKRTRRSRRGCRSCRS